MPERPLCETRAPDAGGAVAPLPVRAAHPTDLARDGWQSPLAAFSSASLLVLGLTGLWIWLGPFSLAAQVQVLLHTLLGILALFPVGLHAWRHWRAWRGQTLTAVMWLGYALLAFVVVSVVSGLVLTWTCLFGPRRPEVWNLVHLVSGVGALATLCVHVPLAYARRRAVIARTPALARAVGVFVRRTLGGVAGAAAAVLAGTLALPAAPGEMDIPESYALSEYVDSFDEYRGSPFAPSYARTASGRFVDPALLSGSASCGTTGCHDAIYHEWLPSAHRFSAMNPPFQAVQRDFAAERGAPEARYCAGCHDPISLFAGAKDVHNLDLSAPGMQEGCSCVVCHSISAVDQRGNGDYVLTPPQKYVWEGETGLKKVVSDFLIRAWPRQHLADYDRNILRAPEFCGACHKQFIPEALNRFGLSPGQNQYDEWRNSHWHVSDPETSLSCRDCHMRLVPGSTDPGHGEGGDGRRTRTDGAHRHHGTIATNLLMPEVLQLEGWERHVALTREWIEGRTVIPEIEAIWKSREGPAVALEVAGPPALRSGERLKLRAVVTNRRVGHNFTTGPLDFMQAWIHLRVEDATGRRLGEWGRVNPETRRIEDFLGVEHQLGNARNQGTLVLEGMPLDADGNLLVRHELWRKAGGLGQRVIFPGYSDTQVYELDLPADVRGPLTVEAELKFRRYRQQFLDAVVPQMERESGVWQPIVTKAATRLTVAVEPDGEGR